MFAEKGFKGANVREIAAQADIKQSALYRHFENKEALYQAVLERSLRPMLGFLEAMTADVNSDRTPEEQMNMILEQVVDLLVKHPHVSYLFQQAVMSNNQSKEETELWLNALLQQGQLLAISMGDYLDIADEETAVIRLTALYNLCVGYFSSASIVKGFLNKEIDDAALISKQKSLLKEIGCLFIKSS